MDGSFSFTPPQLAFIGILLGFLLLWMITFAILALRSHEEDSLEDVNTSNIPQTFPTASLPAIPLQNPLQAKMFGEHLIAATSLEAAVAGARVETIDTIEITPMLTSDRQG